MVVGIDIGSISTNAVMMRDHGIVGHVIMPSGYDHRETVRQAVHALCLKCGAEENQIDRIAGTGYGRRNIEAADLIVTEITCHAVGARYFCPEVNTVIDIGGQDSKVIRLNGDGTVDDFAMNDKCSAGTGRFLEVMARVMEVDLQEFAQMGLRSKRPYTISQTCTVFAESEIISGIAKGIPKEDLVAGLYRSIVNRILGMLYGLDRTVKTVLTGGVAKNLGIAAYFRSQLPSMWIPPEPQIVGAVGAALLAEEWR